MFQRLSFKPGIDVESTATASRGGWNASNLMRWRSGYPEKIGGWTKLCNVALTGICRAINFWTDLAGIDRFGIGTNSNLLLEQDGSIYDITPSGFTAGKASSQGTLYTLLIWSVDNFGQVLLACPSGDTIYEWDPPDTSTAAVVIATAPPINQGMFVASQLQIVIAFGSTPDGGMDGDPLLVRWSDQGDYTAWTATATNQAGSFRLSRGSRIIGGLSTPLANLIWTDLDLWSMQYIGFPLVFSFLPVGLNCPLIGQKAMGVLGTSVYWMSAHGFFVFSGGSVTQIPCTVWDAVFYNLDESNQDKCCCLINYHFNEVWWFFPSISGGTGEIDSYVKFNTLENLWDYGTLGRTAGTDQNQPGGPVWIDLDGFMQQHETGVDADGLAMTGVTWTSGYSDLGDGQDFMFVDQFIPDFLWTNSTAIQPQIQITLYFRSWPGDDPTVEGPFTITPSTEYITTRVRDREVAVKLECDALGTWIRWGAPRVRFQPAGRV